MGAMKACKHLKQRCKVSAALLWHYVRLVLMAWSIMRTSYVQRQIWSSSSKQPFSQTPQQVCGHASPLMQDHCISLRKTCLLPCMEG